MAIGMIVIGVLAVGICGLLIAAVVAAMWVILQERQGKQ